MNSQHTLYNNDYKPNNECFTPEYAVTPLLEFLKQHKTIWCPFDNKDSQFVKILYGAGHTVCWSNINDGQDYFEYEPDRWDIMISNPPFSGKRQIFERALSFGKPFALLMSLTWLNDSAVSTLFEHKDLQLLMFDKRIKYEGQSQKGITFSSGYYCWNILPKQIIFRKLNIQRAKV